MSNKNTSDYFDTMEPPPLVPKRQRLAVFIPTKDRPLQFECCLQSISKNLFAAESCDIYVLAKYANESIRKDYLDICHSYRIKSGLSIRVIREESFRHDFLDTLCFIKNNYRYVIGLTDDTIVWRPYIFPLHILTSDLSDSNIFTLSLRLGENTTIQNPDNPNEKIVIPSSFHEYSTGPKQAYWNWDNRELSTNCQYPISLDGHVYRSNDLFELSSKIPFKNLREWEGELMAYVTGNPDIPPVMTCYDMSYTVNVSCNLTQYPFIEKMGPYGKSLVELQKLFDDGYRVDLNETLKNIKIEGSHQYVQLHFKRS